MNIFKTLALLIIMIVINILAATTFLPTAGILVVKPAPVPHH